MKCVQCMKVIMTLLTKHWIISYLHVRGSFSSHYNVRFITEEEKKNHTFTKSKPLETCK